MVRWIFLLFISVFAIPVFAEIVEAVMPNTLVARAEFRKGDPDKPTVLLMHGFLQTHEFPTIHRLIEGLSSAGYGVLAPTLTLGVTHRKQSLACEAIHTHTMADGANELTAWLDWLKARKMGSIVLVGHSFGSIETLAFLATHRDASVRKLIGISAVEGRLKVDGPARGKVVTDLRARIKAHDKSLVTQQFTFCQKYRASPASMLSYLEWTPDRIIAEAERLTIPAAFIMGSRDDRLGANWVERLQQTKAKTRVIEGANHFMDGDYEFDLLDNVLIELKTL